MTTNKPPVGFKNEVVRTRPAVPVPINYPERRFWRFVDAPLLSKSYVKVYIGFTLFTVLSYGIGLWAIKRFNLFQHKIFFGNFKQQADVIADFPDLDEAVVYKRETFSEKFRKRELERLEQIRLAKAARLAEQQNELNKSVNKSENTVNQSDVQKKQ